MNRQHLIADLGQQLRETIKLASEAFATFGPECEYGKQLCSEAEEIAERLLTIARRGYP